MKSIAANYYDTVADRHARYGFVYTDKDVCDCSMTGASIVIARTKKSGVEAVLTHSNNADDDWQCEFYKPSIIARVREMIEAGKSRAQIMNYLSEGE